MNKLHSLAFYALVTPVITLGAGSLLAEESTELEIDHQQQSTQRDQGAKQSTQGEQGSQHANQPDSHPGVDGQNMREQAQMKHRGYMNAAPVNGTQASDLIGAEVKTTGGENVGPVDDLIIDKNGNVVAIVVGVGGFLGMGEKDVAIGWDDVTRTGTYDDLELQIEATREQLRDAPEFETRD